MKPIKFLPIVMIAAAGLVASCSTSKLAQNSTSDDVYNSVAKAREVEYVAPQAQQQQQQQQQDQYQSDYNDDYYGTSNPYYDMDYSSRINRFYNGYSWQGYYDPYFDNYYYNNNYLGYGLGAYNGYGLGLGLGWNSGFGWNGGFGWGGGFYGNSWGNPYYGWNSWGPNSYYDRFGWGGGWYGGGWGIGGGLYSNRTNYHRPSYTDRNTVNSNGYYPNGNGSRAGANSNNGRPSRVSNAGTNNGIINNGVNYGRPSRVDGRAVGNGNNTYQQRPSREYMPQQPSRSEQRPSRDYTPPTQPSRTESRPSYSPPQSYGGGQSSGGGGGGGGRPSRSGRN
ncbi:hypothetical protein [Pedobacter nototheniae]|uniref:hypothetical protein n=1 Tax=Pedobacter nototheniae TaxID=2488994 RepID=UPI002930553D|nr:hypothetical protein [Pedobacter nototheniae]